MLRMAIVDEQTHPARVAALAAMRVEYVQLRAKTLSAGQLLRLAEAFREAVRGSHTKLLVNTRADVAAATGAHGVHLASHHGALTPEQVREVFRRAAQPSPIVSLSCHTVQDVQRARSIQADLLLFGPVFEKRLDADLALVGTGTGRLREACHAAGSIPVLALGGVQGDNTQVCLDAGAAGVAAIRLFR